MQLTFKNILDNKNIFDEALKGHDLSCFANADEWYPESLSEIVARKRATGAYNQGCC